MSEVSSKGGSSYQVGEVSLKRHPLDDYLRVERMPHIWCPGCGLGLVVNCFLRGLLRSRLNLDKVVIVSGIGCTGRVAGYINLDSFHTTHGRAIPPTTPLTARTTTSRRGNVDEPFNIPHLAAASGAAYVARWTTAHFRRLEKAVTEALLKKGFSLVEIVSPCPTYYGRMNKQVTGLDQMKYYRDRSVIKSGIDPKGVGIEVNGPIVVGKFIDRG